MMKTKARMRAFSLVELVIVIVIIGVIAAIAVPRLSRGAKGAADSALRGDLSAMRNAVDLYAAEHGGTYPTVATFVAQLTTYSDEAGTTVAVPDATHIYGAYLRAIPILPVSGAGLGSGAKGDTGVAATGAVGIAWVYTELTGAVVANTGTATDEGGTLYSAY